MLYYSRLKMFGILILFLFCILISLPNFIKKPLSGIPWQKVHLGLDLQGGSFLLLQLNTESLKDERLKSLEAQIRHHLIAKNLGYINLRINNKENSITFSPRMESERQADKEEILNLTQSIPNEIHISDDHATIKVTLTTEGIEQRSREAIKRSIEIVRHRVDSTGAMDPTIARQGENQIILELPGISDPEHIKKLLGTTAKMTFHLLAPSPNQEVPGSKMLQTKTGEKLAVMNQVEVDGADLSDASAALSDGKWAVHLQFDSKGAEEFGRITTENVGKPFAIVLDDKIITAPVINTPITGGSGEITGNFTAQEASDMALMLRAGALPAPLNIVEQRSIGPTLGASSIHAGLLSLVTGFCLVVIFMLLFYARFGLYADIALFANLLMMLAILSLFEATITLPGMAGILLTLGMAVDANILINERIREEVKAGRKPLQALTTAFQKASNTIIDSNATAFLAHVMLFVFGTGPVKNFALTITIGIITTLFTTLVFSKILIVRWFSKKHPQTLPV